jgi:hypothetical protein
MSREIIPLRAIKGLRIHGNRVQAKTRSKTRGWRYYKDATDVDNVTEHYSEDKVDSRRKNNKHEEGVQKK